MLVFLTAAALLLLFQLLTYYPKRFRSPRKDMICFALSGGVLTYISAFRFNVGYDYSPYANYFGRVAFKSD